MPKRELALIPVAMFILLLAASQPAQAKGVKLHVALAHPYLPAAPDRRTTYLEVGLTGQAPEEKVKRPPVNIAMVLDKSGSMAGEKIARAKEAAIGAIERLAPDDIVSIVAYDHVVSVLVPATRASDRARLVGAIRMLEAGGQTALFAGVSKGAEELRKFHDRRRVNRLLLLSDGQANVGPSSTAELASLGAALGKEGIGVTTIGLGLDYNEDLMTELALRSEGNHFFARTAEDLLRGFALEFGIGLEVQAQQVTVHIACAEGVRPRALLGVAGDILGQVATVRLNQLYAGKEASLLLELEVPGGKTGSQRELAQVEVSYTDLRSNQAERLSQRVVAQFTDQPRQVEEHTDPGVMEGVALQLANRQYKEALTLRDQGQVAQARRLLLDNAAKLEVQGKKYGSTKLQQFGDTNKSSSENLDAHRWGEERKRMRDVQIELDAPSSMY